VEKNARIYVAGGETLIGAAIICELQRQGYRHIVGRPPAGPKLTGRKDVDEFFAGENPEYVFHAAGMSAGIAANRKYPAELILDNLLVNCNLIDCACRYGVKKLVYLASSCCYPRLCPQPMREEYLLTGALEPTNEPYAVAKIAGIKLCQAYARQHGLDFIAAIPANTFGPEDDFSPEDSHVIAALLRRFHEAAVNGLRKVEIWGTGKPRREFLFVDDLADACIFVMRNYQGTEPINLGGGTDISIKELAETIKAVTGYTGRLAFDTTRPDGMPVKVLDSSKLKTLGWSASTSLTDALEATYNKYLERTRGGS